MTRHALDRLAERAPNDTPEDALASILQDIHESGRKGICETVEGNPVHECYLESGQVVFAIATKRGIGCKTVLTEGMKLMTSQGEITLQKSPMPTETVAGVTIKVPRRNERIFEDGAYRVSMDRYHDVNLCVGPSVSSTGIRLASLQSPHAFWKSWQGNPDRYPDKDDSDSILLGRAAHALILGDEVFADKYVYVPSDAPRRPTSAQIAAYERNGEWSDAARPLAEWWEEFDRNACGKTEIPMAMVERILRMAENILAVPDAVEVLRSDLVEISMVWKDEETGLWLKSRPDCIPTNGYDFGDLKTFAPKSRDLVISAMRSTTDFGYPLQMALAVDGSQKVFGYSAKRCALVFVQSTAPHEVIPLEIDEEALYWARVLNRQGINRIANGLESGEWPGVATGIQKYTYPPSMLERFSMMQASGELPNIGA